jgi:hypothetical protein
MTRPALNGDVELGSIRSPRQSAVPPPSLRRQSLVRRLGAVTQAFCTLVVI